jgi:hypothetical protein
VITYGYASWTEDRGATTADLSRNGAPDCTDSEPIFGGGIVTMNFASDTVHAAYGDTEQPGIELLATRCPGPVMGDVAPVGALARATVPLRTFGARRITLRLANRRGYVADGFRGSSTSDVTVALRRTGIRRRVLEVRVPREFVDVVSSASFRTLERVATIGARDRRAHRRPAR